MVFTQPPAAQPTIFFHLVCIALTRRSNHKHRTAIIIYRIDRFHPNAAVPPSDFVMRDNRLRLDFRAQGSIASKSRRLIWRGDVI